MSQDLVPPPPVSSRSALADDLWTFDHVAPGGQSRIDWAFDLPSGGRFSDAAHDRLRPGVAREDAAGKQARDHGVDNVVLRAVAFDDALDSRV